MKLRRIFDSQETASIKEARKLLVEKASMTDEQADKWVRGDLRAAFPILRDKKAAKFILGTTRLFVEQQLNDADAQNKMSRILKEINEAHYDEFDRNLNGKSLSELYSPFEQSFKEADKATREASSSKQFGNSDYVIQGPYDSFEQAEEEWGNNSQDWCVFHREDMYDSYTSAGQRFYVAAKNGWESISKKVGDSAPKDAYGNSLIAISIDTEGNLATSTPRWNHANGGGDNTYTVDELEDIIQMPFYDTFKPYTKEELQARGIVSFSEAFERLASGEDPEDVFEHVYDFHEGFAGVKLNGKYNFIDTHNNLLSNRWFDDIGDFHDGFAKVQSHDKWNFIDTSNNLLSDRWFDDAWSFSNSFARVCLNDAWNFIDINGNLLLNRWFDNAGDFHEGFASVCLNDKWNFIDTEGKILSNRWFNSVGSFSEGFARVWCNGDFNFVNAKGNLLFTWWFEGASDFHDGFASVKLNEHWHHINTKGEIVDSRVSNLNLKRLSKLIDATKRQKEQISTWANKAGKDPAEIIAWAESNFKTDAEQVAAAKWYIDGKDTSTFKQALYICGQKKLDPLKQNPEELVSNNADLKPKEKPINPDDVLTDRQEDGEGNVTYAARDEDRDILRQIINTHFGITASPWCLLQGQGGKLTSDSANYWRHYSAYPKRIAFRDGRLLAFSAGTNKNAREWWDRSDRSFPFIPYSGKSWTTANGDVFEIKKGEVFMTTDISRSRLENTYSTDVTKSSPDVSISKDGTELYVRSSKYPISKEDDKFYYIDNDRAKFKVSKDMLQIEGTFEKYRSDGALSSRTQYEHGMRNGLHESYNTWGGYTKCYYKNDVQDGPYESYFIDKDGKLQLHERATYKGGEYHGLREYYNYNGKLTERSNYNNGQQDGLCELFFEDGSPSQKSYYKEGLKDGPSVEYYSNGNIEAKYIYKEGKKDGPYESYYENGQLQDKGTYSAELEDLVGDYEGYYENGQLKLKLHGNDAGELDGPSIEYYDDGQLKRKCTYKDGNCIGEYLEFYRDGSPKTIANWAAGGSLNGEIKVFNKDGSITRHVLYENGKEVKDFLKEQSQ